MKLIAISICLLVAACPVLTVQSEYGTITRDAEGNLSGAVVIPVK